MKRIRLKSFIRREGSALVATLIFSTVSLMGAGSLLLLQHSSHRMNHKSFEGNRALYLAEAGVSIASEKASPKAVRLIHSRRRTNLHRSTSPTLGSARISPALPGNNVPLLRSLRRTQHPAPSQRLQPAEQGALTSQRDACSPPRAPARDRPRV